MLDKIKMRFKFQLYGFKNFQLNGNLCLFYLLLRPIIGSEMLRDHFLFIHKSSKCSLRLQNC